MNKNTDSDNISWKVKIRSSRPPIHRLDCLGIDPIHSRILDWQWVRMTDLLEHLCGIVIRRAGRASILMPSSSLPSDLYNRYAILCDPNARSTKLLRHCPDDPRDALVTWISYAGYAFLRSEWPKDDHRQFTYVPSGFSNTVLELAEQGIVKVRTKHLTDGAKVLVGSDYEGREKVLWLDNRREGSES